MEETEFTEEKLMQQFEEVLTNVSRLNESLGQIMELIAHHEHFIMVLDNLLPDVFKRMAELTNQDPDAEVQLFQEKIEFITAEINKKQEEFLAEQQDEFPEDLELDA